MAEPQVLLIFLQQEQSSARKLRKMQPLYHVSRRSAAIARSPATSAELEAFCQ